MGTGVRIERWNSDDWNLVAARSMEPVGLEHYFRQGDWKVR